MSRIDADSLQIKLSERAVFIGQTGSGKTTLAKAIAWKSRNFIAIDSKRTFSFPSVESWPVTYTENISDVTKWDSPYPLVYRPSFDTQRDDPFADRFFFYCFERGNCICYVDETTRVTTPYKIGEGLRACLQLGRERKVSTWNAFQRPKHIPQVVLTESEHWFVFSLRSPDDRDRVAEFIGKETIERRPTGNAFWYFNDTLPERKKLRYYDTARVGVMAK